MLYLAVAIIPSQHHPQAIRMMMVQFMMMLMRENSLHSTEYKTTSIVKLTSENFFDGT
jgi:hypothetical protein